MENKLKNIPEPKRMPIVKKCIHRQFTEFDYAITRADINSALAYTYKRPAVKRSHKKITEKQYLIGLFSIGILLLIILHIFPV